MIFGILSDTHDRYAKIDEAFEVFKAHQINFIIHCGDWTTENTLTYILSKTKELNVNLNGVYGNRDMYELPFMTIDDFAHIKEGVLEFEVEGKIYALCHGHNKRIIDTLILEQKFEVIFRGHSHKPTVQFYDATMIINPGSTSFAIPRKKDFKGTVALFDTHSKNCEIVELE